jgi:hypothetical protein
MIRFAAAFDIAIFLHILYFNSDKIFEAFYMCFTYLQLLVLPKYKKLTLRPDSKMFLNKRQDCDSYKPEDALLFSHEPAAGSYHELILPALDLSNSLRSILILSSHLCLSLHNDLLTSGFPTKTLHALHICATHPVHLTLLDLTVLIFDNE